MAHAAAGTACGMTPLQLLSALNWCAALLYGFASVLVFLPSNVPLTLSLGLFVVLLLLAAPHVYLALSIEKGRGRWLQTVLAVLALGGFPVGTVIGALALWVCWFSESAKLFDDPSLARRLSSTGPDVPPWRRGETAWAYATRLQRAGFDVGEIGAGLEAAGFDADDVETTLGALQPRARTRRPVAKNDETPVRGRRSVRRG